MGYTKSSFLVIPIFLLIALLMFFKFMNEYRHGNSEIYDKRRDAGEIQNATTNQESELIHPYGQASKISKYDYELPTGLEQRVPWTPYDTTGLSTKELEYRYHVLLNTLHVVCLDHIRAGARGWSGWDMCIVGPFNPKRKECLVYSFGIKEQWSFDDFMADEYGCIVRSFDPTMGVNFTTEQKRGENIYFYPVGLSGTSGNSPVYGNKFERKKITFPMRTLGELRSQFGEEHRIIDYLKIDIEASEWSSLRSMINDGFLAKYVKQLALEVHCFEHFATYQDYVEILNSIEMMGFRKWHIIWNMHCKYTTRLGYHTTRCSEVYYINLNFV